MGGGGCEGGDEEEGGKDFHGRKWWMKLELVLVLAVRGDSLSIDDEGWLRTMGFDDVNR